MNWRDKSTTGWSIHNVLLDFTGGSLSLLQQVLSAVNTGDWTFVTGNIPKFILGFESMVFDIVFMFQHYVCYGDNDSPLRQSKAKLLEQESSDIDRGHINYSDFQNDKTNNNNTSYASLKPGVDNDNNNDQNESNIIIDDD
eukprot:CAMPEP_0201574000 /NCGR_PEP_ID=MMETSP0190_2-20130828/18170_1 /ASSEMBLY_ACC=CAM_ASM_000263 /TAXON_ID=37353 /ORGANISM="Rosalina sp." /LENGTH=140 /DNA_ID=CAMNT_0048001623 /DNA_START=560 /DNA_END=982 /DNA_ORIENTATION=+